ncbi:hypothetical protein PF001_g4063 [Phytophthora fragariae]|uniref:Uncharacterized protein n=1 Tax=Phytophthora fragariae TaxID=53985 RepID=A0A6A4EIZ1_9STRA|nr:hypothetical protein PF001_g4063 [Phytophthora fragariae]
MTATGATTAPGRRLGMKISAAEEATPLRVQAHATTIRVAVVATGPALAATVEGTITIGAKATPTADATATTMIAMVLLRLVAIPKAAALDMVGATTVLVATAMTDCVVMVVTTMAKPPGVETIMVALAREATTTPPRLAVLQGDTIKDALRLKAVGTEAAVAAAVKPVDLMPARSSITADAMMTTRVEVKAATVIEDTLAVMLAVLQARKQRPRLRQLSRPSQPWLRRRL